MILKVNSVQDSENPCFVMLKVILYHIHSESDEQRNIVNTYQRCHGKIGMLARLPLYEYMHLEVTCLLCLRISNA
jgi:hypothetical protein